MSGLNLVIDSARPAMFDALAASLPATLRRSSDPADLVVLDGQGDWPARLGQTIASGARKILLTDPVIPPMAKLDTVIDLITETGTQLIISEAHGDDPAIPPWHDRLGGPYASVTIVGSGPEPLAELALQQLRLARSVGLADLTVIDTLTTASALIATIEGQFCGAAVLLRLSVARSQVGPTCHRLMANGPAEAAFIELQASPGARPANAWTVNAEGGVVLPTIYEGAHRAALRALASEGCDATRNDLVAWRMDVEMAGGLAVNSLESGT